MKKILASLIMLSALLVACYDHEPLMPIGNNGQVECSDGTMQCENNTVKTCSGGQWKVADYCALDGLTCTTDPVSCGFDSSTAGKACCVAP